MELQFHAFMRFSGHYHVDVSLYGHFQVKFPYKKVPPFLDILSPNVTFFGTVVQKIVTFCFSD